MTYTRSQFKEMLANHDTARMALLELAEKRYRFRHELASPFLKAKDFLLRTLALDCLKGFEKDEAIAAAIVDTLRDDEANLRISAIEFLVTSGSPKYLNEISRLASDKDALVRAYAIWAICELGSNADLDGLENNLPNRLSSHEEISLNECRLIFRNNKVYLDQIIFKLNSKDPGERSFASAALRRIAFKRPEHQSDIVCALEDAIKKESVPGPKCRLEQDRHDICGD